MSLDSVHSPKLNFLVKEESSVSQENLRHFFLNLLTGFSGGEGLTEKIWGVVYHLRPLPLLDMVKLIESTTNLLNTIQISLYSGK